MPIIFAQAIMFLPLHLLVLLIRKACQGFVSVFTDINGFGITLLFFI